MFAKSWAKLEKEDLERRVEKMQAQQEEVEMELRKLAEEIPRSHLSNDLHPYIRTDLSIIRAAKKHIKRQETEVAKCQSYLDCEREIVQHEADKKRHKELRMRELREILNEGLVPATEKDKLKEEIYEYYSKECQY